MYFVSPAGNLFRYVVTTGVEVGTWFTRRHGDSVVCIRTDIVRGKIQIHELITKGGNRPVCCHKSRTQLQACSRGLSNEAQKPWP